MRITRNLACGLAALAGVLLIAGCKFGGGGNSTPSPHYVVGDPYQIGTIWRYPRVQYGVDFTGLATLQPSKSGLTANGEAADQNALAASLATVQLPAIVRVTNLENGRQILVRVNDRGPDNPARSIALSRHAAQLLGITYDGARVRVQMDDDLTRQLAATFDDTAPKLDIQAAPAAKVQSESLAPPSGVAQSNRGKVAASGPAVTASAPQAGLGAVVLKDEYWQTTPKPGLLYIDAGNFARIDNAYLLSNRLSFLNAKVSTSYTAPPDKAYRVRIGPFFTLEDAQAALSRAISAGVNDAAIIVD